MSEERPDSMPEEEGQEGFLDDLESLLDEEGEGMDDPDLESLFDEEEDVAQAVRDLHRPSGSREERSARRQRDLQEYQHLEGLMMHGPIDLLISDDRLVARINRIAPEMTYEQISQLIQRYGITHGIDEEGIREGLVRAGRGQVQRGVVVAQGTPPRVVEEARTKYRDGLEGHSMIFAQLHDMLLEAPNAEGFHSWHEPVPLVVPGEVLAELVQAEIDPGRDVFGQVIGLEMADHQPIWAGENTSLGGDGASCLASIYGYAGLIDGEPCVLPPLWVAPDRMEVCFIHLPGNGVPPRPPTADELLHLLQLRWIEYGILEEQIAQICDRLQRGLSVPPVLLVARGDPAHSGEKAQIQYVFEPEDSLTWNQFGNLLVAGDRTEFEGMLEDLVESFEGTPVTKGVRRNDVVAEKIPPTEGLIGRDVEGEELVPTEGEDFPLEVGENIWLAEDGLRCMSTLFGYVCMRLDQINVVPPLWISPIRDAAYFLNLPQQSPALYPSLEEMYELLERFGVKHGFRGEEWVDTLASLESGQLEDLLIPIAKATPFERGKEASFKWQIDIEREQIGKVLEDGSIDFRERNLTTVVKEGDLIGVLTPTVEGTPGIDVLGNEISPPRPVNIEVLTDARIEARDVEEGIGFFAGSGGGVTHEIEVRKSRQRTRRRIRIGISPISNIEGDVDYSTGNIDFHGDVIIQGSVQSLFSVKATGGVSIGGYVEAGAFISTGKNIAIKGGVVGANTELVAGGSVMAKFIQEATIRAVEDVQAGAYIFNASVRAGGRVIVLGKGEGKSRALVGGLIWGGKGIEATSIGSPYNTGTRLVVGVDPDRVNRLDQLRANIRACEERQQRLMEKIGVESLDMEIIRRKLQLTASPQQKKLIVSGLKRIARVTSLHDSLHQEVEELAARQRQLARQAFIIIHDRLFSGVEVRMGEETLAISEDRERIRLRLTEEDNQLKILADPLRS